MAHVYRCYGNLKTEPGRKKTSRARSSSATCRYRGVRTGALYQTRLCFVSTDSSIHHGDACEGDPTTDPGHPPGARRAGEEETRTRRESTLPRFPRILMLY